MNAHEAQAIVRLIAHLDGSILADPTDLADEVAWLVEQAGNVTGFRPNVDKQALVDALSECGQRHCDAGRP